MKGLWERWKGVSAEYQRRDVDEEKVREEGGGAGDAGSAGRAVIEWGTE